MHKLLDYSDTHPSATLQYKSCGMVLKAHSDVLYLLGSQERSIAGGFFYMGGTNKGSNRPNGAIVFISTIMRNVMPLAAEAECGVLF